NNGGVHVGVGNGKNFAKVDTFSWHGPHAGLKAGESFGNGLAGFKDGDCLHFCFDEEKMLTMFSVKHGTVSSMGPVQCIPHLHLCLLGFGTKVILSPLNLEERVVMNQELARATLV
ncbi:MAG: hypothetical protein SGARI_002632, partial [Bacillariaceae sp.]